MSGGSCPRMCCDDSPGESRAPVQTQVWPDMGLAVVSHPSLIIVLKEMSLTLGQHLTPCWEGIVNDPSDDPMFPGKPVSALPMRKWYG